MTTSKHTRLRYFRSEDADKLTEFVGRLPYRIQIYDIVYDGTKWYCWHDPGEDVSDPQPSLDLEEAGL